MTVFSKVVTGVKRRGKVANVNEAGSSSQVTPQSRENSQVTTVAPDLRRYSDFMNPFPAVSPGGYTKYYQAKAKADPGAPQYALPPLCELNQRPPASRRPPTIQTSGLSTKHRSSRKVTSTSNTLASIPESSSDPQSAHSHDGRGQDDGPQGGSLRRRKRRVLRTPSVERDFAQHALLDVHPTLGRAASISSSQSSNSAHSPSSSTDSHSSSSMQSSPSSEFPRTPVDNAPLPRAYLFYDPFDQKELKMQQYQQDWEPFERPDSRSTYRTARTHFDDI